MEDHGSQTLAEAAEHGRRKAKRRRRVQFAGIDDSEDSDTEDKSSLISSATSELATSVDLARTGHFCSELSPRSPSISRPTNRCAGHLDACCQENFRHSFFPCCADACGPTGCQKASCSGDITRVDEILAQPRSQELSIIDQLQLAVRVVSAVLKFNSTPWLGDYWGLQNLAFFQRGSDLPASLKTLHLGVELGHDSPTTATGITLDAPSPVLGDALEDAKLIHGIQNPTLYNLGVALLCIARWDRIDPNDVLQVRLLAPVGYSQFVSNLERQRFTHQEIGATHGVTILPSGT
jgi:hypothetical protein